ncbi:MAG: hypothetical protein M1825_005481 [Sarcosagium campestre]|nr:MAG: hypothetical protein M1825_005481 [Sarcosagium campestre]
MHFSDIPTELVLQVFRSCTSISDVHNLAASCRRFHQAFNTSQRLSILQGAAEAQYGPLQDAIQLVTHNASQAAHKPRHVPWSMSLLESIVKVGRVAERWEDIYPVRKWKHDYEDRRLLNPSERMRLRRAIYRLWLYAKAFHNPDHPRDMRGHRWQVLPRMELLLNWPTAELAELEDVRAVLRDVIHAHICPSNGTVQRKFRKRFPDAGPHQQISFNAHVNYPPPAAVTSAYHYHQQFISTSPAAISISTASDGIGGGGANVVDDDADMVKFLAVATEQQYQQQQQHHELGNEGWGDEIPHYYVVEDMLKLDPAQILWLRDRAPLKRQVEAFVRRLGDWFENNGETLGQTLDCLLQKRGEDPVEFRHRVELRRAGVVVIP